MSYTIQLTHIPFKDNLKGKSALLELNLLEAKINQLIYEKSWDILQVCPQDEELKHYLKLKDLKFFCVVDCLIEEFADQYRMNIIRIVAFIAMVQTARNIQKASSGSLEPSLGAALLDVGVMLVSYLGLKALQLCFESFMKAQFLMRYRLDILVPQVNEEVCAICIDAVFSHQELVGHITSQKVKHVFHKACIKPLVERMSNWFGYSCPLCRERVFYYRFKEKPHDPC